MKSIILAIVSVALLQFSFQVYMQQRVPAMFFLLLICLLGHGCSRADMAARKASNLRQREAAFRQLDSNKDGSLTLQEFNSVAAAQQLPKADVTQTLSRFDTNKDGRVSRAENQAPAVARFDRSDSNKDGTLSVEEQQRARPKQ